MTTEIKIKPGPELDCAVAEAIGTKTCHPFRPSTDLNAAFAAAEKVGLFDEFWRTLGRDELGETWGVFEQGFGKTTIAGEQHETPALAICAAILELKET